MLDSLPFSKKKDAPKELPKPARALPSLAHGVLAKESLASPADIPHSLPPVVKKAPAPEPEAPSFFAEHKVEPPQETPKEHKVERRPAPAELEDEASFFASLAKHLSAEESLRAAHDPIAERNLVDEMKTYWDAQKAQQRIGKQTRELESDVLERVEKLRMLEQEWQRLETHIEEKRQELAEKERAIEQESHALKALMRRWHLKRDVEPHHSFVLSSGHQVKNVAELAHWLARIDDHHFAHHVELGRNDFANWVRDVYKDEELANELAIEHSRERTLAVLHSVLNIS